MVKVMIASSIQWMSQNMSSHERTITKRIELSINSGNKEGASKIGVLSSSKKLETNELE